MLPALRSGSTPFSDQHKFDPALLDDLDWFLLSDRLKIREAILSYFWHDKDVGDVSAG